VLVPIIMAVAAALFPCRARGDTEPQDLTLRRYVGFVTWLPASSDVWDFAYGIRYLRAQKPGYITGVIGIADPASVALQRGSEFRSVDKRWFGGVGVGAKVAQWGRGASFVGVGATLYWVESGPSGEGWVYIDSLGRVLGPAHNENVFLSPEIIAHVQVSRKVGVYLCANLSSEGQPPKNGIYLGVSIRR
jgi:hypothetical protein